MGRNRMEKWTIVPEILTKSLTVFFNELSTKERKRLYIQLKKKVKIISKSKTIKSQADQAKKVSDSMGNDDCIKRIVL